VPRYVCGRSRILRAVATRWLPSTRGLPRAFWVLWAGTLVNRAGAFVMPFLALYLVGPCGLSVERAGEVAALAGLGSLGAGPLAGALADRVGRRFALAAAGALGAAAMLALGFARRELAIEACAFALGLFGEMYRPVSSAIVADVVNPSDRARAYGLLYWAVNLGFSIAPAAAGLLAAKSYRALFFVDGATTLAFTAMVVRLVPETRPAHPPAPISSFAAPYVHRAFLAFAAASLLLSTFFHQIGAALPIDMGRHGISPRSFGLLLALNGVLIVLLQPVATTLQERWPRGRVMAWGAFVTGVGFGIPALAAGTGVYALSIAVWTLGEIAMSGISLAVVADFAPPHLRASYQGAFQLAWAGGCALAPVVGALVLVHFGSTDLWAACFVAGVLSAVGFAATVPAAGATRLARANNRALPLARTP
jgi:MFS family permease